MGPKRKSSAIRKPANYSHPAPGVPGHSLIPVSQTQANFYLSWRAARASAALQEGTGFPSEYILQQVWYHQRLSREALKTCDGQPIRVLHPGFWNVHAGPDFKKAMVQVGSEVRTGDIEIDLLPGGW